MILVILGTQDKDFSRLLKAVDREIENGTIQEKVVVQAGQTKYQSKKMEIFDFLSGPQFDRLVDQADLIITHGGVGSILAGIKKNKKIIAAARLSKYKEHHNDHQKQIIKEFVDQGYLLELREFNKLGKVIEKSKSFKPKKFESNNAHMIELIEKYIEEENHISWFNRYRYYLLAFLMQILLFAFLPISHELLRLGIASGIPYVLFLVFGKRRGRIAIVGIVLILLDIILFLLGKRWMTNIILLKFLGLILLFIFIVIWNLFSKKGGYYEKQ